MLEDCSLETERLWVLPWHSLRLGATLSSTPNESPRSVILDPRDADA